MSKKFKLAGWWWRMPLIPALGRQRQADLCEFEASLVYRSLFPGQPPKPQRKPYLETTTTTTNLNCLNFLNK